MVRLVVSVAYLKYIRLKRDQTQSKALALARMLSEKYGIKKGGKVAILMRNRPDWVVVSQLPSLSLTLTGPLRLSGQPK